MKNENAERAIWPQAGADIGLPPLADYLKNWGILWNVEEYKQEQNK